VGVDARWLCGELFRGHAVGYPGPMRHTILILSLAACAGSSPAPQPAASDAPSADPPATPVALSADETRAQMTSSVAAAMNPEVDPCDDFYQYACGGWLEAEELPSDRSRVTRSFWEIDERNKGVLREILDDAAANASDDPAWQRVGDFYAACLDEEAIDARGVEPVAPWLELTAGITDLESFARVVGQLHALGADVLYGAATWADMKDPDTNILHVGQGGYALPDRDYYLDEGEEKADLRDDYVAHVARTLQMVGFEAEEAEAMAGQVLAFEAKLAEISVPRSELRDPTKTYHKIDLEGLEALTPHFSFATVLGEGLGAPGITDINVEREEYFAGLDEILAETEPEVLRSYATWHAVHLAAPDLASEVADEHFAFFGRRLRGQEEQEPRWRRCADRLDRYLGDLLGQAYVDRAFGGDSKPVALDMIRRVERSFEAGLDDLAWMDDETRSRAKDKAGAITNKIGYPDEWKTYDGLELTRDDHFGNMAAAREHLVREFVDKVGQPVDPAEWFMSASTVNAYYNPSENEIVFPAGILQPPMFHRHWPMAANFGGMGMVMGHEISHGFDDSGRQFTADGRLEDWWEPAAAEGFEERAQCVVDAYGAIEARPGLHVDGKLTLGENIADIGGARFGFRAYQEWVEERGEPEPEVAGLSGEELYFVNFAQVWCSMSTDEALEEQITTDPHTPAQYRVNGALRHTPEFHQVFECEPGTGMRPESDDEICVVW